MADTISVDRSQVQELNLKIDRLAAQVEFLTQQAEQQRRRQQEWDELKDDLIPIGNEAFRLAVEQLEEVEQCARTENILHLLKRLLRNTCNLQLMLDQMESLMAFWQDFSPLTRSVFVNVMNKLDDLERRGYFRFAQGMLDVSDQVVTSFSEEDLHQMSNNIGPVLEAVKVLTQPQVVDRLQKSVSAIEDQPPSDTSMLSLVRQLNDPAVRRGLAKTLQVLKAAAE